MVGGTPRRNSEGATNVVGGVCGADVRQEGIADQLLRLDLPKLHAHVVDIVLAE